MMKPTHRLPAKDTDIDRLRRENEKLKLEVENRQLKEKLGIKKPDYPRAINKA